MNARALMAACAVALTAAAGIHGEAEFTPAREPSADRPDTALPRLLSETGLYGPGGEVDQRNRPFSPQYPLWSDGAAKSRWVRLPEGATIDVRDVDRWDFPVGTRFWKEFRFGTRKVETRFLRREADGSWTFASYAWNEAQTDAVLAPADGLLDVAEIAPGKRHTIPSVTDCRACHDPGAPVVSGVPGLGLPGGSGAGEPAVIPRTDILGFSALQLSTDRDPNAPHAEPLPSTSPGSGAPEMITLRTLVDEGRLSPARPELAAAPPRIAAPDARTRAVLGYLSTNCGSCHNEDSSIANLGLFLKARVAPSHLAISRLAGPTAKWQIPNAPGGASRFVTPGAPDLSAILVRMKSRRPSSQMPPLGTVLHDRDAIDLVTAWIESLPSIGVAASD